MSHETQVGAALPGPERTADASAAQHRSERGEGLVVFVGAGPGAVDLITLRAARVLADADLVIWASSLVNPEILGHCRPDAERVESADLTLEDVEQLYARARDERLLVARLHTGDPAIYGATAEQRDICRRVGIAFESVPGVSAYSAAAAAFEQELTVPEVSQSFILTRMEGRTPMPARESVRDFATHGTTMALYLSAARSHALQEALLGGGYDPATPCLVGYRVSWPDQMLLRCRLDELSDRMKEHKLWKHTVILVGPALADTELTTRSLLYHPGFRHAYRPARSEQ